MNNIETISSVGAMKLALEALETLNSGDTYKTHNAATALRQAIEQAQKQEPVTIWYMRDNHTFKKLSEDVSTALIEIEQEFNEGHTYGMLCSKRKGFPSVHASGDKKRLEFFAECKATLEQWLPKTSPPPRPVAEPHKPLTDEQILEIFGVHLHEDDDIEEFRHLITDARHNQLY